MATMDKPGWRRGGLVVALLCGALAACQRAGEGAPAGPGASGADWPRAVGPFSEGSERVWSGLLPCRDCAGVDTRLVLQLRDRQHSYLLTETYLGGQAPNRFTRAGRWIESERALDGERVTAYTLDPGRAAQVYVLRPDGSLELLDAEGRPQGQPIAYRLQRL
jgi:copper homeostasis protein (lipoprotein)